MEEQILDNMDLERERGITIKARAVELDYKAEDGEIYVLNLIDTPGHVDFNYEVSRSLAACEGAVLVVDASQGIEAQTLANTYLAVDARAGDCPGHQQDRPARRRPRQRVQAGDRGRASASRRTDAPAISAKDGTSTSTRCSDAIVQRRPRPEGRCRRAAAARSSSIQPVRQPTRALSSMSA